LPHIEDGFDAPKEGEVVISSWETIAYRYFYILKSSDSRLKYLNWMAETDMF
jgi:hypothetical protein